MTHDIRLEHRSSSGGPAGPRQGSGLLARMLGLLVGLVVLSVAFVLSAVLLVVVLLLGTAGLGWFWWKTRAVRRAIRERQDDARAAGFPDASRPLRETSDPRRPRRMDDVSDARILGEEPRADRVPRR